MFCENEKLFVKEKQSFKINTLKVGDIDFYKGQLFTKAKMTDEFWMEFLNKFLGQYLEQKYKYQSSTDGILDELIDEIDE